MRCLLVNSSMYEIGPTPCRGSRLTQAMTSSVGSTLIMCHLSSRTNFDYYDMTLITRGQRGKGNSMNPCRSRGPIMSRDTADDDHVFNVLKSVYKAIQL